MGHRKGKSTKARLRCNFGCAHPEGYRKALRKMQLAERLGLPIVTMINTPGAYPGIGAEERGQAAAIAENIICMFELRVPIVAYVIGEGGSGGALGIGIADSVQMLEYSYYSVISPEGCAAILWKDGARSPEAAEALGSDGDQARRAGRDRRGRQRAPRRRPPRHRAMIRTCARPSRTQLAALETVPATSWSRGAGRSSATSARSRAASRSWPEGAGSRGAARGLPGRSVSSVERRG